MSFPFFCDAHALFHICAVRKGWHDLAWRVLVMFAINGHLSVRKVIFASADGPFLIQSLPAGQNGSCKCEQRGLQMELRCLQVFLARLQVRAVVSQIELPLHYIFKILRHGLRDDLRAIHPYTLFLMYTYSLSAGCFGPQEHTHDLLYQDFSNSLFFFWRRLGCSTGPSPNHDSECCERFGDSKETHGLGLVLRVFF